MSRSPQGERGLKFCGLLVLGLDRVAHRKGGRGLKLHETARRLPALCRSPQGGRGLKSQPHKAHVQFRSRSPQGGRGLK